MICEKIPVLSRCIISTIYRLSAWYFSRNKHQVTKIWKSEQKILFFKFLPSLLIIKAFTKEEHTRKANSLKIVELADNLYDVGKYEELFKTLNDYKDCDDPEILWRLARSIFENCKSVEKEKAKLEYYESALQLVEKAIKIEEKCWAAHKWNAILLDYVWRYKSTKGRIIHSFDIRRHMERAIELNPSDGTSYYLLGEWCYTFADMPWYQRNIAAAIFASPPTSTYQEALDCFEKAEKVSPLFYSMNLLMLGKCHLQLNNKEKGIMYLKQARDYQVKTLDDQKAHEEAEKLLKELNV